MATSPTIPTTLVVSTTNNPSSSATGISRPINSPVSALTIALGSPTGISTMDDPSPDSSDPNNSSPSSPVSPDSDAAEDKNTSLLNYYYVFLALFVVILGVVAWGLHRRQKAKKRRSQNRRQTALARDVDGFLPLHRRWVPGNLASRIDRHNRFGTRALDRDTDEEGLNEFGEAPPPYLPPAYKANANENERHGEQSATVANSAGLGGNMPAVPLRTLSRGAVGKPPGYDETIQTPTTPTAPEAALHSAPPSNRGEQR